MRYAALLAITLFAAACGGGANPGGGTPPPGSLPPTTTTTTLAPLPPPPTTTMLPAGPTVVRMAAIGGAAGHSASGSARIIREGSSFVLELGSDFRIDSGNNDVMLTRQPDTRTNADLNLGNMRSLTGQQRYDLPNDASSYTYVMLWCRPFRIPIGVGELR